MSGIGDALGGMMSNWGNTLSGTSQKPQTVPDTNANNTIENLGKNIGQLMSAGGGNTGAASGQIIRSNPYADADLGGAQMPQQQPAQVQPAQVAPQVAPPMQAPAQGSVQHVSRAGTLHVDPQGNATFVSHNAPGQQLNKVAPVDARGMPITQAPQVGWGNSAPVENPIAKAQQAVEQLIAEHRTPEEAARIRHLSELEEARRARGVASKQRAEEETLLKKKNNRATGVLVGNQGDAVTYPDVAYYVPQGGDKAAELLTPKSGKPNEKLAAQVDPRFSPIQDPKTGNILYTPAQIAEMERNSVGGIFPQQQMPKQTITAHDADLKEPSGPAHWTLREQDNFILAKNQRTGELNKLVTQPLSKTEQREVLSTHGAGPLGANDPNRQARQMNDMDLKSPQDVYKAMRNQRNRDMDGRIVSALDAKFKGKK